MAPRPPQASSGRDSWRGRRGEWGGSIPAPGMAPRRREAAENGDEVGRIQPVRGVQKEDVQRKEEKRKGGEELAAAGRKKEKELARVRFGVEVRGR